jgi:hypothetical protein
MEKMLYEGCVAQAGTAWAVRSILLGLVHGMLGIPVHAAMVPVRVPRAPVPVITRSVVIVMGATVTVVPLISRSRCLLACRRRLLK